MKQIIIDCLGVAGFAALTGGVYLQYGLPVSLMLSGSLVLGFALLASRNA
ncbi:hypothetical protein [Sansalvadorimonas verongulae]|nr:hypothetical protein [Sansalvadorimonas verongulae]